MVTGDADAAGASGRQLQQETPTPANETVRHEDPDRIDRRGDLDAVQGWLAGRMGVTLEDCLVQVGVGSTNVCELDDDYPTWVEKYVDVAEETETEADDERGETYTQAAEDAEEFSEEVKTFEETYEAYQNARQAGNEERARELARELLRQRESIAATGENLRRAVTVIEDDSGRDLSDARGSVNGTIENVTAITAEIESELLVATTLLANLTPRSISFLEPGTVTGRLVTENGSGVADEPVTLVVGDRSLRTRTDDAGRFSLEYRPTTVPVTSDRLELRYVPRNNSVYLGSDTTVPVSISQVEPTVAVSVDADRARFGETVQVSGTVSVGDVRAAGVPVAVTLGDRRVGTVETDAEGRFTLELAIGAEDGPGDVTVRAALPFEGRALASAAGESTLTIQRTATTLAISPEPAGTSQLTVEGALETVDTVSVGDQPVTIRLNGTAVETVRTGRDGRFRATLTVPASLRDDGRTTLAVVGAFDGRGTNLRASSTSATVVLSAAGNGEADSGISERIDRIEEEFSELSLLEGLALAGLLALVLGSLIWRRWPLDGSADVDGSGAPPASAEPEALVEPPGESGADSEPIVRARERLGTDTDSAVMLAYAAARANLTRSGQLANGQADTHWEFLSTCREDGLEAGAIEGLTDLTERYEQAAYSPGGVSRTEAQAAIQKAESLL
jgi:hypothetical protein